ncbi:metadherin a isoform X1 [Esox lucius]|uniref:Metadherin a n=1 Tax=Esox lucius TaxID=8010 RepID=A0A3P8YHF0_ESOLU|nr:metadherin a isoform X1 [Esox lucius]
MATDWQALAIEKAELISSGIRQLLSSGQGYFRSEFGVELGLTPEIYPSWVILSTAVVGLLVVLVLSWAAFCGRFFGGKKKRVLVTQESDDLLRAQVIKIGKPEEQKKKTKKKSNEKKAQSNGRTVPENQQEVRDIVEISNPSPEIKTEKVKKNKKKAKPEVKQAKTVSASDGKEPDDGAWETKVSNREKRQQKRKEKGPDGGVEVPHYPAEQLLPPAPPTALATPPPTAPPTSRRGRVLLEPMRTVVKGNTVMAPGSTSWREEHSVNGGGWSDISMKLPVQLSASDVEKWPAIPKIPRHRNPDPSWGQETEGSWLGIDRRMKTELKTVPFPVVGLGSAEPLSTPAAELTWEGVPQPADDDWTGLNGITAADPSSDWNAPTELWGNYEEPSAVVACVPPPQDSAPRPQDSAPRPQDSAPRLQGTKGSDEEKEKDDPAGGAVKSKKKKKKKKKPEEEGGAAQMSSDSSTVTPVETSSLPPPAATRSSGPIASSQKLSDPSFEAPKPSQKKKARRET